MGLEVGKTFNSQKGGVSSDKLFYTNTLNDFNHTVAKVPGGAASFDYVMVETWYYHPLQAAPETQQYTTTYTALAVMDQIKHQQLALERPTTSFAAGSGVM